MLKLVLALALVCASASSKETLKIGTVHYPPYFDFSPNGVKGTIKDQIENKLSDRYRLEWLRIPLARGESSLNSGGIHVYAGYMKTDTPRNLDYSETPMITLQPSLCRITGAGKLEVQDIRGQLTIYPQGSSVLAGISEQAPNILRLNYHGDYIGRSIKMLEAKRARFFVTPESRTLTKYKAKHPNLECIPLGKALNIHLSFKRGSPLKGKLDTLFKDAPTP